ncbi:MAG TPA: CDP-diacylglycerol--glycerol-3-phosphate 3-phosphatidyltransferase, partial [Nitrospira sp.]|nr:CDP-diacylglycerol--glycerol-3-phosphate 3-phosphatidyltransferase [Nitrospira sp.]
MHRVLAAWRAVGQESLNLPNLITLARILLIPVFVILFSTPTPDRSLNAAIIFVIAAVSDLLDGYIARRTGQVTTLGKLLDPIADKLLVLSALILLVNVDRVSAMVAILVIAREVAVTGIRAIAAGEGMIIAAEATGKYKMALQVVAIPLLILEGTSLAELG